MESPRAAVPGLIQTTKALPSEKEELKSPVWAALLILREAVPVDVPCISCFPSIQFIQWQG